MTTIPEILAEADEYRHALPVAPKVLSVPTGLDIARWIDHTLLRAEASSAEITQLCDEARQFSFASVCVNPSYVSLAAKLLDGSKSKVCSVVGFPLGATLTAVKALETKMAIENGATEIDMVVNIGAFKDKEWELALNDMQAVLDVAKGKALVKVILETSLLTRREKIVGCLLAKTAGVDFVKTSTGFGTSGATVLDVTVLRRVVGAEMGVKASGGIHTLRKALMMINAGANRLGTSLGMSILKEIGANE